MPEYKATMRKTWYEYGEVQFQSDNLDDARQQADMLAADDGNDIEWEEMTVEDVTVYSVEEI